MNTENNKRKQNTRQQIQESYKDLILESEDLSAVSVSDICKKAGINRTTFYSHFFDINDLHLSIEDQMMTEFLDNFKEEVSTQSHSLDFNRLFSDIKNNQEFYQLYFLMGFDFQKVFIRNDVHPLYSQFYKDSRDIDYHLAFFCAGITAIIRKWLEEGCPGQPEHLSQILIDEYQKTGNYDLPDLNS